MGAMRLFKQSWCRWFGTILLVFSVAQTVALAQAADTVFVYAAGSLRAPLTQLAQDFEAQATGVKVELIFGASGLLKDRIAAQTSAEAKPAHVFASANMEHPQALAATERFATVRRFTRNALCALTALPMEVREDNLVSVLLNPAVKVGISTPRADPSGDYTWQMFERIEATGAGPKGSADALKAKALQLTGGPNSPAPPADRNVYGMLASNGQADIFITYCTNAAIARAEVPNLRIVPIAAAINVSADYGMTVARTAPPLAQAFAEHVMSSAGQAVLQHAGFAPIR
jgi:molybdate transport system substrate-binding protein